MTRRGTTATIAAGIALLAAPAIAPADRSDRGRDAARSSKGSDDRRSDDRRSDGRAKQRGFELSGTELTGLAVADGKLTAPFSLDPRAANQHARASLELTRTELRGQDTVTLGTVGDAVVVRYRGLAPTAAILPTDRVKVQGRLVRTVAEGGAVTRTLDLRRITIKREDADDESDRDGDGDSDSDSADSDSDSDKDDARS